MASATSRSVNFIELASDGIGGSSASHQQATSKHCCTGNILTTSTTSANYQHYAVVGSSFMSGPGFSQEGPSLYDEQG